MAAASSWTLLGLCHAFLPVAAHPGCGGLQGLSLVAGGMRTHVCVCVCARGVGTGGFRGWTAEPCGRAGPLQNDTLLSSLLYLTLGCPRVLSVPAVSQACSTYGAGVSQEGRVTTQFCAARPPGLVCCPYLCVGGGSGAHPVPPLPPGGRRACRQNHTSVPAWASRHGGSGKRRRRLAGV